MVQVKVNKCTVNNYCIRVTNIIIINIEISNNFAKFESNITPFCFKCCTIIYSLQTLSLVTHFYILFNVRKCNISEVNENEIISLTVSKFKSIYLYTC